ncbi:hypothetical protein A4R35_09980 [Thermogemmatispora tikiterensis]|uniref:Uncharacterized protein n=1 Tax=Thermogemmatispora tikiterensis TaxID=1825093 RepID=A0A328VNX3_9CHLR|nr:hypothetical protein A4R35_09980 [Thermogemmatispora tikiterensis]
MHLSHRLLVQGRQRCPRGQPLAFQEGQDQLQPDERVLEDRIVLLGAHRPLDGGGSQPHIDQAGLPHQPGQHGRDPQMLPGGGEALARPRERLAAQGHEPFEGGTGGQRLLHLGQAHDPAGDEEAPTLGEQLRPGLRQHEAPQEPAIDQVEGGIGESERLHDVHDLKVDVLQAARPGLRGGVFDHCRAEVDADQGSPWEAEGQLQEPAAGATGQVKHAARLGEADPFLGQEAAQGLGEQPILLHEAGQFASVLGVDDVGRASARLRRGLRASGINWGAHGCLLAEVNGPAAGGTRGLRRARDQHGAGARRSPRAAGAGDLPARRRGPAG